MGSVETVKTRSKKDLVKLISYMVMGDGGVYKYDNKEAFFAMNMKQENKDYIEFCKDALETFVGCTITERKVDGNRKPQFRLQSKSHPFLTILRNRIYIDNYKGLDPHTLKLLDAEALAILYMCDGSICVEQPNEKKGLVNPSYNITLNMKRLSYGDQFILKKALKEILDLEWNINRQNQYYYLRLRSKDVDKFMELVTKFVLPSFQYKIKESFRMDNPLIKGGETVRPNV